ncbi:MAG: hypothetical protein RSA79_00115 [Oscillospiraceae bacterium]
MSSFHKIDVRFDEKTYSAILILASKRHITVSELIRKLINQSLSKEQAADSVDFIREQIREEIVAYCKPQFNRLAKLSAKIGYRDVASFDLLCYIIDSILPESRQHDFDEVKLKSKLQAIAYLKLKDEEFEDFITSEDTSMNMLNLDDK